MKSFGRPFCEVVRFDNTIIATSNVCGCWDGEDSWPSNCTGDVGYCACKVNFDPHSDNCTPCATNQGA